MKSSWRARLKMAAFVLTPAVVVGLLMNVAAGITIDRRLEFVPDTLTGSTEYRFFLGRWPWSHRSVTRLNSRGFPDEEFSSLPPKGECVHIVLAGDSFTFSDAIDGDKSWASLVRARARAEFRSACVRVFNIASPVTTIEQQLARVRETRGYLQPDLVLLGQYQNDVADLTNPGSVAFRPPSDTVETTYWGDRLRLMTPGFDLPLPRMIMYRVLKLFGERGIKYDILSRWSVMADSTAARKATWLTDIYEAMFDSLATELRDDGVGLGVVILPSKLDLVAHRYPEGEFFESIAAARDIPRLPVFPVLDANRRPFPYLTYDGHLNERGNSLVATAVFGWLFAQDSPPFPEIVERIGRPRSPLFVQSWPK